MAVNKNREAELARQDDRLFLTVVEKNRRAVATVIDFPLLPLPFAVTALQVEGVFFKDVPEKGVSVVLASDRDSL